LTNQGIANYTLLNSGVPDNSVISVQLDQNNQPWFASTSQGIFTDSGNQTWFSYNVLNSAIPSNSITAFELDENDNFLIGTQQDGFALFENGATWSHYHTNNSLLPDNHVLSCTRDSNQVIWLGTGNAGLVRLAIHQNSTMSLENSSFEAFPNPIQDGNLLHWSDAYDVQKVSFYELTGALMGCEFIAHGQKAIQIPATRSAMVIAEWSIEQAVIRRLICLQR